MPSPDGGSGPDPVRRSALLNARLGLSEELVTLWLADDQIEAQGREGAAEAGRRADEVVDLEGRTVLPGLWDHHVHFDQQTFVQHSLDLTGAAGPDDVVGRIEERLQREPLEPGLPLVGYGFRDGLWPRPAHRYDLDAVSDEIALVMVSADLHQGWLNAAALRRYGLADDSDGLVREHEWFAVLERVSEPPPEVMDRWVAQTARAAAARGVVGIVDFENTDPVTPWPRRHRSAALPMRVRVGVWPAFLEQTIATGLRSGDPLPGTDGLVRLGNLKVISDGSLNTRTAFCYDPYPGEPTTRGLLSIPPAELGPLMERAWRAGIGCSIHAIGDHANTLVLDCFADVGAAGTIEHVQLLTDADVARFAALGVAASVQPEHAHDDRDVADHHWAGRTGRSFPYGALHRSGARLLLGSDAPVAPLDPLLTVAAAISRSRDGRAPWHPEHELPLPTALAASTGTGRETPAVGDVADLTILDLDLRMATAEELRIATVAGTLVGGRWTHRRGL